MEPNLPEDRLRLYRRAAGALNAFFGRWTGAFCGRCLEVTARAHPGEADAAMELVEGRFAGCCQAGVAETLAVPCGGGVVEFPADLAERMGRARAALGLRPVGSPHYTLRQPGTGRVVAGRGCRYLGDAGCGLGELKAPLCLTYVCTGIRSAIETAVGPELLGEGDDDFCGAAGVLRAVAAEPLGDAEDRVEGLENRLREVGNRLRAAGFRGGEELLRCWLGGG